MLDERRVLLLKYFSPMLRLLSRIFWIAAFVLATYCWMVIFEHGVGWKGFSEGFRTEWHNLASLFMGKPNPPT